MTALVSGARLALARLFRASSLASVAVALLAVAAVALLERRAAPLLAADRTLTHVALAVVLPLLAYGSTARALAGKRLERAVDGFARHGANRRVALGGALISLTLCLAVAGTLIAAVAVLVTRIPADPLLLRDLATSSWIGALAGAVYAGWFALGSSFGSSGGGRVWALGHRLAAGRGRDGDGTPWPHGHVRNLLGAEPMMHMPEWSASLALVVLATCSTSRSRSAVAALRLTRRNRREGRACHRVAEVVARRALVFRRVVVVASRNRGIRARRSRSPAAYGPTQLAAQRYVEEGSGGMSSTRCPHCPSCRGSQ